MRWSEGKTFLRRPSDKEVQSILLGYSALLGRICIVIFVLFAGATRMWSKSCAFGVHKGLSCPDCLYGHGCLAGRLQKYKRWSKGLFLVDVNIVKDGPNVCLVNVNIVWEGL